MQARWTFCMALKVQPGKGGRQLPKKCAVYLMDLCCVSACMTRHPPDLWLLVQTGVLAGAASVIAACSCCCDLLTPLSEPPAAPLKDGTREGARLLPADVLPLALRPGGLCGCPCCCQSSARRVLRVRSLPPSVAGTGGRAAALSTGDAPLLAKWGWLGVEGLSARLRLMLLRLPMAV